MARLIKSAGPLDLRDPLPDGFAALVRSIMYQQLAGAAASTIHGRFLKLFADGLSPAAVLALPEGAMRTAGVSGSKAAAIADLALKVSDGTVPLHDVEALSDDELVARLILVRGIGRWTAEMFLMFPAGAARRLARRRLRRAQGVGPRAQAQGTARAPRPPGRGRQVPALQVDRRPLLLARRRPGVRRLAGPW